MKALMALAVLGLAACAETPAALPAGPTLPSANDDTCNAAGHAGLIGKPLSDPAVPAKSPDVRHIRPGDAVTEDYRMNRLNFYADEGGRIDRISCG
jgi:hypothetical protein